LASGSLDDIVRLWDVETGQLDRALEAGVYGVFSLAYSPDGRNLALGGRDATVRLWDASNGRLLHTLK
ncbi:MAG: hypothetical protein GTN78_02595, partial [Gemmatimonadales bacterium]|nr:hypothetical protein [Gemmatimonadales bacterium]